MQLTTLGTSHGDPTYCRFNSSTLVEAGAQLYLIDTGEPVTALMTRAGKSFDALRAVFVTHMHGDHVGGLPALVKRLIKYPSGIRQVRVFLPEDTARDPLGSWLQAMHISWPSGEVATSTVPGDGPFYDDGVLRVAAVRTRHLRERGQPTYAYVLEAEDTRLVATGDLSADFSDFPDVARNEPCDTCLCEITHFQPEVALPILMGCPIGNLVLNHVHDPWHGKGEERLLEILAPLPYPVAVAHDGDEFDV